MIGSRRVAGGAAALLAAGCAPASADDAGRPCLVPHAAICPLLVGDTARLTIGTFAESPFGPGHCDGRRPTAATWASADTAVARVTPDGLARRRAGPVRGDRRGGRRAPAGPRVRPAGGVGVADSPAGGDGPRRRHRALPPVPFSLYTPEFLARVRAVAAGRELPVDEPPPLTDKWSQQHVTGVGVFRGERPGTTTITGVIGAAGARPVQARLTILPAADPR